MFNSISLESYKILSVSFICPKSHRIVFEPLYEALANNNHSITVLSTRPLSRKNPNIREIVTALIDEPGKSYTNLNYFKIKSEGRKTESPYDFLPFTKMCSESYAHPEVVKIMDEKYDLVILSSYVNECAAGLVHKLNTSLILASPFSAASFMISYFGGYYPPSYVPNLYTPYLSPMSFYERVLNLLTEGFFRLKFEYSFKPQMEAIYRKSLNDNEIPSVNEILSEASLLLSNSHFSIGSPLPLLPDIVEVGGMHCRPPNPLSKELEEFVRGEEGFKYFSMGSIIRSNDIPERHLKIIIQVFSKLKFRVLWKWDGDEIHNLPPNVKLSKWLPQQDLLGHPKIKVFITHGGFGSTTEAVYHSCPLIGLPMYGDQLINMEKAARDGYAISLDWNKLDENILEGAINEIINQPKYKEKVSELSKLFRDQPQNALDRAVFWVEYILRHKGAKHLRSAGRDLNFVAYHSIDVIGFLIISFLIVLYLISFFLKLLYSKLLRSNTAKNVKNKIN